MKIIKIVFAVCMLSVFSMASVSFAAEVIKVVPEKKVEGASIIRLHSTKGVIPSVLRVRPGHTVIWLNEKNSLIEIQFTGKQVTVACDNPVNFVVDEKGSFVSNKIPLGAVASLCMIQKGEYDFYIKRVALQEPDEQAKAKFQGKIIVE